MPTNQKDKLNFKPLIIIGAGRSGTNMLRDVLADLPGVVTWPCDEINYIWRHGNRNFDSDEIPPEFATPDTSKFIRDQFIALTTKRLKNSQNINTVLEKTCANSLRVGFVDRVLPEARYINIIRDGRNVVASATQRWKAPLDIPYLFAKTKYVPISDLPYYAINYVRNRFLKLISPEQALSAWGPRFEGMREIAAKTNLESLCAHQWVNCVEKSQAEFSSMPSEKYIEVKYENFIHNPSLELENICDFMSMSFTSEMRASAVSNVRISNQESHVSANMKHSISLQIMTPLLKSLGYVV